MQITVPPGKDLAGEVFKIRVMYVYNTSIPVLFDTPAGNKAHLISVNTDLGELVCTYGIYED